MKKSSRPILIAMAVSAVTLLPATFFVLRKGPDGTAPGESLGEAHHLTASHRSPGGTRAPRDADLSLQEAPPGKTPQDTATALWRTSVSASPAAQTASDELRQAILGWLETDAIRAVEWVQALPPGSVRSELLGQLSYEIRTEAAVLASADPQKAAAWLRDFPEGEAVESAMALVAGRWAGQDPQAAIAYMTGLPPENSRNRAANALATAWALSEPNAVAAWIGQLPEGALREKAMEGLVTAWAFMGNPNEAAKWLEELPQARSRDVAINTFSAAIAPKHPEAAFQWASTISDPALRNARLAGVAQTWLAGDPQSAKPRVLKSGLPDDTKRQLLAEPAAPQ
jgi:hypothetical protein